jgi:hypothetical protein
VRVSLNLVHMATAASSPSHLIWSKTCVVSRDLVRSGLSGPATVMVQLGVEAWRPPGRPAPCSTSRAELDPDAFLVGRMAAEHPEAWAALPEYSPAPARSPAHTGPRTRGTHRSILGPDPP